MPTTMPGNAEEAAYAAFAIVDELLNLLVTARRLDVTAVNEMLVSVANRLSEENNFGSQRAAQFVADRMPR